jgi:RNA polymerase sigma factor for flagellar operon FliA
MRQSRSTTPEANANILDHEARDRLILAHLPQVERLAKRIYYKVPANVDLADLVSAGILGLICAIAKFDPTRGIKLKTFAEYRIRGAMLDSLRDLDWAPRELRVESRTMQAVFRSLEQRLGRLATEEEKCDALGISLSEFHRLTERMVRMNVGSLEDTAAQGEPKIQPLLKRITDSPHRLPSTILEKSETRGILDVAIEDLPKRERLVISLYYFDELTMAEIGEILAVNESRISQMHSRAVHRLRARLKGLDMAA